MVNPVIELSNGSTSYGETQVLNGLNCEVGPGEFVGVIGSSGSGKSTLLRALCLLQPLDSGCLKFNGEIVADHEGAKVNEDRYRERVGLVHQEWNLWPDKTVLANVTEALKVVKGYSPAEANRYARSVLGKLQVGELENRFPFEISGGEKQRVALGRALAMKPQILLLDEITSALDLATSYQILCDLRNSLDFECCYVWVSHQLSLVSEFTDRVYALKDGLVVESGPTHQVLSHPSSLNTKELLKVLQPLGVG